MNLPFSYVISFDLESSNIFQPDQTTLDDFPTICQLGYVITGAEGEILHSQCDYVHPRQRMTSEAIKRHGISQADAERLGKPPDQTIEPFLNLLDNWRSKALIVGWNATKFDMYLLEIEALRLGRRFDWNDGQYAIFDLMHALCPTGTRWEKLEAVYSRVYEEPLDAHDAESDALACSRLFFHFLEAGKISPASYHSA